MMYVDDVPALVVGVDHWKSRQEAAHRIRSKLQFRRSEALALPRSSRRCQPGLRGAFALRPFAFVLFRLRQNMLALKNIY